MEILKGVLVGALGGLVSSCFALRGTKHTYVSGGQATVAGAELTMAFRPEGSRSGSVMVSAMVVGGGMATLEGPFSWRVVAVGTAGVHEGLVVHRVRTRTTKSGRDEWYPSAELGRKAEFRPWKDHGGKVRARYPIPGLLKVQPEEDGKLEMWVDLSVRTRSGDTRKTVHFELDPAVKDASQVVFLPKEVVESFGREWEDWDDPLWE
ncbi:hypothetical protein HNR46_001825 [Haloferula luteola]|uniref:Lipoprotein n=1 Tax=Haloferula luteola TaxID=595692 RepID=A0A840VA79_9BACT|nr:hypothetical protein [Haloferula luteola]MBB5351588.1 hypothetical protein [Haloferula luteola]